MVKSSYMLSIASALYTSLNHDQRKEKKKRNYVTALQIYMLFVFGAIKIQTVHTTGILQSIFTNRKIFLTLENLKI